MKDFFKKIIVYIITFQAKLMLIRYRPKIVTVTGTVGKTTTKDMMYEALLVKFSVRKNQKSLNSEIGVPLTILGFESGWNNPLAWLKIILLGFLKIIYVPKYPRWLVLETGIDKPGDMDIMMSLVKPEIAVFTAFGKVPVHVEFFDSPEAVMAEKSKMIDYVNPGGAAILNADDKNIMKLKSKSERKVYTFGITEEADLTASNSHVIYEEFDGVKLPVGMTFKINYDGNVLPMTLKGVTGDQYVYPAIASVLVGTTLGISAVETTKALTDFKPAPGRMNLIRGINHSMIVDDTYNSSPLAVEKALASFNDMKAEGLKIAVLGDMLEIGKYSHSEHQKIGQMIKKGHIDYLVTVGFRAETIAEQAVELGMPPRNVKMFRISETATDTVKDLVNKKKGSIVLVKGSQGIRMEKIVKEIMAEPEKAKDLLVRQESEWLSR